MNAVNMRFATIAPVLTDLVEYEVEGLRDVASPAAQRNTVATKIWKKAGDGPRSRLPTELRPSCSSLERVAGQTANRRSRRFMRSFGTRRLHPCQASLSQTPGNS